MLEKHSLYEYEIVGRDIDTDEAQYDYVIYLSANYCGGDEAIESEEWFETEQDARHAAIERIDLLENGEK
jgi:hypothetical protein